MANNGSASPTARTGPTQTVSIVGRYVLVPIGEHAYYGQVVRAYKRRPEIHVAVLDPDQPHFSWAQVIYGSSRTCVVEP